MLTKRRRVKAPRRGLLSFLVCLLLLGFWQAVHKATSQVPPVLLVSSENAVGDMQVVTLDWTVVSHRKFACQALEQLNRNFTATKRALYIRNAPSNRHFKRLTSIGWLRSQSKYRGLVLTSASNRFTLFNNSTTFRRVAADNASALPSTMVQMSMPEFLKRWKGDAPPLKYPGGEFYYWQQAPPNEAGVKAALRARPFGCLIGLRTGGMMGGFKAELAGVRLRITTAGARHVLHYDTHPTLLLQLAGQKQITLVAPSQLPLLHTYPDHHVLARRAQVDLDDIDAARFPDALQLRPLKIVMGPGDVLVFPPLTGHVTVSLADSFSITARLKAGASD